MTKKGASVTLSLAAEDKALLEQIALEQGCKWGEKPNVSLLVERIARREIPLGNPTPQTKLIHALALVEKTLVMALEAIRQA